MRILTPFYWRLNTETNSQVQQYDTSSIWYLAIDRNTGKTVPKLQSQPLPWHGRRITFSDTYDGRFPDFRLITKIQGRYIASPIEYKTILDTNTGYTDKEETVLRSGDLLQVYKIEVLR
jgi:hypothetical protein